MVTLTLLNNFLYCSITSLGTATKSTVTNRRFGEPKLVDSASVGCGGRTHQSIVASASGIGTYLRASYSTASLSSFWLNSGIGIVVTKLLRSGQETTARDAFACDSRNTSPNACRSLSCTNTTDPRPSSPRA